MPRDYLRRYNRWDAWKTRAGLAAIFLAGAFALYPALADNGEYVISHGPLIAKHQQLDAKCQACHVSFTPISGSAGGQKWPEWVSTMDSKCLECHKKTGPHSPQNEMYDKQLGALEANCAVCHRDHLGRSADIKFVADQHCTVCHANLADHMDGPSRDPAKPFAAKIESFAAGHPDFRSIKVDPGKLKFNHALHMTAGLPQTLRDDVKGEARKEVPRQPTDLVRMAELGANVGKAAQYRELYGTGKSVQNEGWVQLDCSSCHERTRDNPKFGDAGLASGETGSATVGKNYLPVLFERHCVACHQLPYQAGLSGTPGAMVVHKSTPDELSRFVRNTVYTQAMQDSPELDKQPTDPERRIPGNEAPRILSETKRQEAEQEIRKSAEYLTRTQCVECHTVSGEFAEDKGATLFPAIAPTKVPRTWYAHAKFDHTPHVTTKDSKDCRTCHEGAFGEGANAATNNEKVMIPDRDNCVRCHAPNSVNSADKSITHARSDCVECHGYHQSQHPWPEKRPAVARSAASTPLERYYEQSQAIVRAARTEANPPDRNP
ncbi:MAG: hypothetical protein QM811_27630 [Pirellulales bacterium]